MKKLGMIDYGRGNLRSVINACQSLDFDPILVTKPEELSGVSHLIFPGQGAFGDCMERLDQLGLIEPLRDWIAADNPYFGICVGYQLLFETSEESKETKGLGVVKGHVRRFRSPELKVPHMGWNGLDLKKPHSPYWSNLESTPYYYFVHSYYPQDVDEQIVAATCTYGAETFCAAIERGNLLATQFHPEKSQHEGLTLLRNFLEL
jgi:imidazole glycerol phosphate synthase glutamine amidotransferase subunit